MINLVKKKLLGELLIERNIITQEQLIEALKKQQELGKLLGVILEEMGIIEDEADILPIIAEQQNVNYTPLRRITISTDVVEKVPVKVAKRYRIMPIYFADNVLTLAMARPYDVLLRDELRIMLNADIRPVLASSRDISEAIGKYYGVGADTINRILDVKGGDMDHKGQEVYDLEAVDSEATIGSFLNQIFLEAYQRNATDIHIEPGANKLIIRYRIDGVLQDIAVPENVYYFKEAINSRIKIMANLDIAEKRLPQDGRLRVHANDVNLDMRVSFLPTPHGESAVIRILNATKLFGFDELDMSPEEKELLKGLIKKPNGIIFITGPTGSGKTTTLYSSLATINTVEKKIITIEDPVEYQLPGVTQIQINPKINLSFARGLRSILRHDPNVIMVGEVRDVETAEIAIQVALTGHLVFSTLHTNDAASGVTRLINMGIEPYLITSTVECFIAQRLIRLLCTKCKKPKKLNAQIIEKFGYDCHNDDKAATVYEAQGCEHCNFTGYKGRTGIFEFLMLNDEVCDLVLQRANAIDIKKKAVSLGMKTLRQSGWGKVREGVTTLEEVIRVTQERSKRNH